MFYFESAREWRLARSLCHKQNSEMATAKSIDVLEALANQRKHLKFEDFDLFLGLKSKLRWTWVDGEKLSNARKGLWKPTEPSGDGTICEQASILHVGALIPYDGHRDSIVDRRADSRGSCACARPGRSPGWKVFTHIHAGFEALQQGRFDRDARRADSPRGV